MSINEIISEYAKVSEMKSYYMKQEKQLKAMINDFVNSNNISDTEKIEQKNIPFETKDYIIIMKKTIRDNFDSKAFFDYMGTDVKKEFSKPTLYLSYEITEKAHKETEKTA